MKKLLSSFLLTIPLLASPARAGEPGMAMTHAVLVPGIWQKKWRCFGFLRNDLQKLGVKCLTPDLSPVDGSAGITSLAEQLKRQIDQEFGNDQKFVVIAFSMGGLVSRTYLQDLGGAGRCTSLVTISTPHHGTRMAKFHYGRGAAEMRPGSIYLHDLEKGLPKLDDIPLVTYRTPMDAIIIPSESSVLDRAENISIPCPIHPLMTFSPRLRDDLLARFTYPGR